MNAPLIVPASTPPMVPTYQLRPYQNSALDQAALKLAAVRKLLLVAPTGGGKTLLAAELIRRARAKRTPRFPNGRRILFLVHRKELADQTGAKLESFGVDYGMIMGSHPRYRPWLPVQVASVQTLGVRQKPAAELVIVDEAHHARAGTYEKILEAYPDAKVVGLTATPWRGDGKGLGDLFDDLVVAATPQQLIDEGFLVPCGGFAFQKPDGLDEVRKIAGDYDEKQLGLVMSSTQIVGDVVNEWRQRAENSRTVVFAVNREHSQKMVAAFVAAGVAAEHVDGTTPKLEREAILARWRRGETRVVSNCAILTEGFDLPLIETCVLVRPTTSLSLYLQMLGRALRPCCRDCGLYTSPLLVACTSCGSTNIKRRARLLDHANCAATHGLPHHPRDYSLTTSVQRQGGGRAAPDPIRTCKGCLGIYEPELSACPLCGLTNPKKIRKIVEVAGIAVPLDDQTAPPPKPKGPEYFRAAYFGMLRAAVAKNHKLGRAWHQFTAKFGREPAASWRDEFEAKQAAQAVRTQPIGPAVRG